MATNALVVVPLLTQTIKSRQLPKTVSPRSAQSRNSGSPAKTVPENKNGVENVDGDCMSSVGCQICVMVWKADGESMCETDSARYPKRF